MLDAEEYYMHIGEEREGFVYNSILLRTPALRRREGARSMGGERTNERSAPIIWNAHVVIDACHTRVPVVDESIQLSQNTLQMDSTRSATAARARTMDAP